MFDGCYTKSEVVVSALCPSRFTFYLLSVAIYSTVEQQSKCKCATRLWCNQQGSVSKSLSIKGFVSKACTYSVVCWGLDFVCNIYNGLREAAVCCKGLLQEECVDLFSL